HHVLEPRLACRTLCAKRPIPEPTSYSRQRHSGWPSKRVMPNDERVRQHGYKPVINLVEPDRARARSDSQPDRSRARACRLRGVGGAPARLAVFCARSDAACSSTGRGRTGESCLASDPYVAMRVNQVATLPQARELTQVRVAMHPSALHDVFGLPLVSHHGSACLKDRSVASSHEGPRTIRSRPTSTRATTTPLVGACVSVSAICARSCT